MTKTKKQLEEENRQLRCLLHQVLDESSIDPDFNNVEDLSPLELNIAEFLGTVVTVPPIHINFSINKENWEIPIKRWAKIMDENTKPFSVKVYFEDEVIYETDDVDICL